MTEPATPHKIPINRGMVGLITLGCFAAAVAIRIFARDEQSELWFAGFIRVGLLMAAFWLALPSRHREAAWANVSPATFVGLLAAVALLPRYPRFIIPIAVLLAIVGYVLRPRKRDGVRRHQ